jgi:hypothetical protein
MKKGKVLSLINEANEKPQLTNMNEDSFYDGYKFVEYGKNITNVSLIFPSTELANEEFEIDKNKLVINWGVKFEFRNSGIEGVQITVLGLEANLIKTGAAGKEEIPINFGEYKFEIIKEKNVENKDVQIYVASIEIDAEQKVVNVVFNV